MTAKERKQGKSRRNYLFVLCILLFTVFGCSNELKQYTRPESGISKIRKVAVLPIDNFAKDEHAGEKVRSIVIIEVLSRGIDVVEPGEVLRAMKELKLRSSGALHIEGLQDLGKLLGVDAVIMGSVETFGIGRGVNVSYPEVSVNLMLVEAVTGDIIWSVLHNAGGPSFWTRHFGAEGSTLDETARKVVKEAFDTLYR